MAAERIIRQGLVAPVAEPPPVPRPAPVVYPDSDGRFLPENRYQADAIVNLRLAFADHFRPGSKVVVEGDMFIYYREGDPSASVAPDLFVVLDHDMGERMVYKLWEEGKVPDLAVEVVSPSSEERDERKKLALYEKLGFGEYFLFQPDRSYPEPRVKGYRLRGGAYERVLPEPGGWYSSPALGVQLRVEGTNLRVRNLRTGKEYAWSQEVGPKFDLLRDRAEAEAEARREADRRAEAADRRAEVADRRAEEEAEARRAAEVRLKELEARLRQAQD